MDEIDEDLVTMARAICVADGNDPDKLAAAGGDAWARYLRLAEAAVGVAYGWSSLAASVALESAGEYL